MQFVYVNVKNHTLLPLIQICLTARPENVHNLKPYHKFETEKKQNNTGSGLTVIAKRREMSFGFFFFISYGRSVKQEFTLTLEPLKLSILLYTRNLKDLCLFYDL